MTVVLFFIKKNLADKYKKSLIKAHVILLLIMLLDIFIINFKGVWFDRLIVVAFLLTASLTFALYRRTLRAWQKLYFGFFLIYPIVAAATFLIDSIFFIVVASPLLFSLYVPEVKFSSKNYELREFVGSIAPVQLQLIKKGFVTEKYIGASNNEKITYKDITGFDIIRISGDTTFAWVKSGDISYEIAFHK
ncbi:MAG: hypothetical protein KAY50_02245 [Chitinophagaceae bacterium]|nr:hypothetical protein [Chitinophagaceae bacterium]